MDLYKILKLKPWQLFLLLTGPLLLPLSDSPGTIAYTVSQLFYIWWLYATGSRGQQLILKSGLQQMSIKSLKASAIIATGLNLLICFLVCLLGIKTHMKTMSTDYILVMAGYIIVAITCLQMCYFSAKTLMQLERNRDIFPGEWLGNLIQFTIFPIGLWILQRKIKGIMTGVNPAHTPSAL